MVDRLGKYILKAISVSATPREAKMLSEEEIEKGVLLPAATAEEIKNRLKYNVAIDVIEESLKRLEEEGYVKFESGKWRLISPPSATGNMKDTFENLFSRYQSSEMVVPKLEKVETKPPKPREAPPIAAKPAVIEGLHQLQMKREHMTKLLSELKQNYEMNLISKALYTTLKEHCNEKLEEIDKQVKIVEGKRKELMKEIVELERELSKKRLELERISGTSEGKRKVVEKQQAKVRSFISFLKRLWGSFFSKGKRIEGETQG